jgi:hypothetical protein
MTEINLDEALAIPRGFRYGEVSSVTKFRAGGTTDPSLGPLVNFTGTFKGNGFNTIFRPDNKETPTPLPKPVSSDNVLELNLTEETLSFAQGLGSVPNRGEVQGDIFLNGVPYLQAINDVTIPSQPIGIHVEPGLWMIVPATTDPAEGVTLMRMASIPHGTTVLAQGTATTAAGAPTIPAVDITPFEIAPPNKKITFASQTATNADTARIPQDLTAFIAAGTLTQDLLNDPNTLLRNHIASQTIVSTTTITISTSPTGPLFGGGTDNMAFLLGDPSASAPNANAVKMNATFWIETVQSALTVPAFKPGQPPLTLSAATGEAGQPVPTFQVDPPVEITEPRQITVTSTQIQYSQEVFLNFNGLSWPHVSVATLAANSAIPVPASAWAT